MIGGTIFHLSLKGFITAAIDHSAKRLYGGTYWLRSPNGLVWELPPDEGQAVESFVYLACCEISFPIALMSSHQMLIIGGDVLTEKRRLENSRKPLTDLSESVVKAVTSEPGCPWCRRHISRGFVNGPDFRADCWIHVSQLQSGSELEDRVVNWDIQTQGGLKWVKGLWD